MSPALSLLPSRRVGFTQPRTTEFGDGRISLYDAFGYEPERIVFVVTIPMALSVPSPQRVVGRLAVAVPSERHSAEV